MNRQTVDSETAPGGTCRHRSGSCGSRRRSCADNASSGSGSFPCVVIQPPAPPCIGTRGRHQGIEPLLPVHEVPLLNRVGRRVAQAPVRVLDPFPPCRHSTPVALVILGQSGDQRGDRKHTWQARSPVSFLLSFDSHLLGTV